MPYTAAPRIVLVSALLGLAALADPLTAQTGRGFLFEAPDVTLGARAGFGVASAGSDIFDFTREELTVDRGDFNGFSGFADLGFSVLPRLDLTGTAGYIGSVARSESRRFEGTDDLPIRQRTEFRRVPLTAGVRLYPLPRGRTVGSYAWIPASLTPYVGGAAGGMWYRFRQEGEFVDEESLVVFEDVLESSGWAPAAEAFGGIEYTVTPRIAVIGEGRYTWARAELSNSFEGFDPIDLAGFAVTVGVSLRY